MNPTIACIVEGQGDVRAVPELVRRIARELDPPRHPRVPRPVRLPRTRLEDAGELERAVGLAAARAGVGGAIMLLADADQDCPAELGPRLHARVRALRSDLSSAVILANTEFESWFLAAAGSLAGQRGLPPDLAPPSDPEAVRGAKEWLTNRMPAGRSYRETADQAALAALMDLGAARRSPSFDRCYREVQRLVRAIRG